MKRIKVMVNGLPGKVAGVVARHVVENDRFELIPYSLTGPEITDSEFKINDFNIQLVLPDMSEKIINNIKIGTGNLICIDFTHPSAVNSNAEFYCRNNLPFVMGTTGGDRELLDQTVARSSISAIIAPNMAKQIVGFQAMMEYTAKTFPGLFTGYSLKIEESHQKGKADTSGTAKAMTKYFNSFGIPFSEDEIIKERDPEIQKNIWKIPEEYLDGHGWHKYTLISGDGTVRFEFSHTINGREIYGEGTLDAVSYLHEKIRSGILGKVFTMIDVLKGVDS